MSKKCLVLFSEMTLLTEAIENLLSGDPGLEVIPVSIVNRDCLYEALRQHNPDVIVLVSSSKKLNKSILTQVLEDHPGTCVITVGMDNARITIHPGRNIIREPADLLSAIHSI